MTEPRDANSEFETSGEQVLEAIGNFLANVEDQLAHVERKDVELGAYVGRRLDQSWRWLDLSVARWLEERYQTTVDPDDGIADMRTTLKRLKRGARPQGNARTLMGRLLHSTGDIIATELRPAVRDDDARRAAVASYLARRWFTKYRVLKWRWLEAEVAAGVDVPAYRWFES